MSANQLEELRERLNRRKPPTLVEVGEEAGVGTSTVRRARLGKMVTRNNARLILAALDRLEAVDG